MDGDRQESGDGGDHRCGLCGRVAATTEHHLVPRSRRKRVPDAFGPTAQLCRDCHRKVHATFDNKELSVDLRSLEALRSHPEIASYLKWIRKKPASTYFGSKDRRSRSSRR